MLYMRVQKVEGYFLYIYYGIRDKSDCFVNSHCFISAVRLSNMKKLPPIGIKSLRFLHLCFATMWVGGTAALLAIVSSISYDNVQAQKLMWEAVCTIDRLLITPGAILCLLSGLLFSAFTQWGFFKHGWVVFKWIATITLILVGTFILGPWLYGNMRLTQDVTSINDAATIASNTRNIILWGTIQLAALLVAVVISVFKPKKKKQ